ncbi:MAG: hypothetical protein KJO07_18035 [Deltaproteobacteria bacterium]|nr:hypothetical protein [Deltaproteobacteria bacterium]
MSRRLWAAALVCALGCVDRPAVITTRSVGTPATRSPQLDDCLFRALPELVIAVNESSISEAPARARLVDACPGPSRISLRLAELAAAMSIAKSASADGRPLASWLLALSRQRLNRALGVANAAYVVDSEVVESNGQRVVLVMSFEVDEVLGFEVDGRRFSALLARRRDRLNWSYQLLGFTNALGDEALVLLDAIDADLLVLLTSDDQRSQLRLEALETELEDVALGQLRARARSYAEAWQRLSDRAELKALVSLGSPTSIPAPREVLDLARQVLTPDQRRHFVAAHDRLASDPALPAVRRHQALRTASHEVQHLVDGHQGTDLVRPVPDSTPSADAVGAELSAYLAEMAHSPVSARSSLARLIAFAHDDEHAGLPEAAAARLALTALGRELAPNPLRVSDFRPSAFDPVVLAQVARRSWELFFGRPLARLQGPI